MSFQFAVLLPFNVLCSVRVLSGRMVVVLMYRDISLQFCWHVKCFDGWNVWTRPMFGPNSYETMTRCERMLAFLHLWLKSVWFDLWPHLQPLRSEYMSKYNLELFTFVSHMQSSVWNEMYGIGSFIGCDSNANLVFSWYLLVHQILKITLRTMWNIINDKCYPVFDWVKHFQQIPFTSFH